MYRMSLANLPWKREYKNNGQHAEQVFRFTVTGEHYKADNLPYWVTPDCDGFQIKSGKACACRGDDLLGHIARDTATAYAFVLKDFHTAIIMTPAEYIEFVKRFHYDGTDSRTGEPCMRIKGDTDEMYGWFDLKLNGKTRYNMRYWYLG